MLTANSTDSQPGRWQFRQPNPPDKLFFFLDGQCTLQRLAAPVAEESPFTYSGSFVSIFKANELMGRLDYSLSKTARLAQHS